MNIRHTLAAAALLCAAGSAGASIVNFTAELLPEAAGATGSGQALIAFDTVAHSLSLVVDWSGLSGLTTVAHIHCCTANAGTGTVGVAVSPPTLLGFPAGVSAGHYETFIDLTVPGSFSSTFINDYGSGSVNGAIAALLAGFGDGKAYLNIHSSAFPAGEIRGFLTQAQAQVPEPAGLPLAALAALALSALTGGARRRR
ncbi:MAG: CHRD domain-containing protein [Proteobacteria bacterium]|nr:CHRD domain-containing protein [Pseudomonadota bacterium]